MKPNATNYTIWRVCAASILIYYGFGVLGFAGLAGNFPPAAQFLDAKQITQHYLDHGLNIRIGMVLALIGNAMYVVISALTSQVMQRIEGKGGLLSQIELLGGVATVVVGMVSMTAWLTASFRTEARSPEVIQALHDFGWMFFNLTFMVTTLQQAAIGIVFLSDKRRVPLMPGWFSYLTFFSGSIFFLLPLMPFFNRGPFAWHGLITFWVSLSVYFTWVGILILCLLRAFKRLEQEEQTEQLA